jgi:hypothetical protein
MLDRREAPPIPVWSEDDLDQPLDGQGGPVFRSPRSLGGYLREDRA